MVGMRGMLGQLVDQFGIMPDVKLKKDLFCGGARGPRGVYVHLYATPVYFYYFLAFLE